MRRSLFLFVLLIVPTNFLWADDAASRLYLISFDKENLSFTIQHADRISKANDAFLDRVFSNHDVLKATDWENQLKEFHDSGVEIVKGAIDKEAWDAKKSDVRARFEETAKVLNSPSPSDVRVEIRSIEELFSLKRVPKGPSIRAFDRGKKWDILAILEEEPKAPSQKQE